MDYLTIIMLTAAGLGLVGLAWLSGYEFGSNDAANSERALANQQINRIRAEHARDVVAYENNRNRRKAGRKVVRA